MSRLDTVLGGNPGFIDGHSATVESFFRVFRVFFADGEKDTPPTKETLAACQSLQEYLASRTQ